MNIVGWIVAVVGLVGLIYGLRMMLKGKKMGSVPFHKPSEIAQKGAAAADAKQMVSTEGQANLGQQPLRAPMSGEPCIGYEITVERRWEKFVQTEKGQQKKTGNDKVHSEYRGAIFQVTDGQGAVTVDASERPDADFDQSHKSSVSVGMMIPGTLHFGQLQMNTPHIGGDARTTSFEGTEKVIKPSATLYALGQVGQGAQGITIATPKGIGTGKLILHPHGRTALAGKTKTHMLLGFILGGVFFAGGTGLGIFGPKADMSGSTACSSPLKDAVAGCDGRMFEADGVDYQWTVATAGVYTVTVKQPKVANPVDGALTIYDGTGTKLAYNDGGSPGADAMVSQSFAAGTYKINVADFSHGKVEGGFGFKLSIEKKGDATAPSGSASAKAPTIAPVATGPKPSTPAATTTPASTAKPATTAKPAAPPPVKKPH